MNNDFDFADKLVNQTLHDVAMEVAKISLSRETQNTETDPKNLSDVFWEKYTIAKKHLAEKTQGAAQTIRNNRKDGAFWGFFE